ncbi:type I toxin-antitoxin system toxin [Romboutsia sp.]|uniref:type I toxin-antitoxin system toxin n=1 Tax=Romboutsia sp. TaxID=1965302 RepID=UPI003F6817A0
MELMMTFITGAISSICIGLTTNYIYDKIKNHSSIRSRKSGLEFEFKIKFKFIKK